MASSLRSLSIALTNSWGMNLQPDMRRVNVPLGAAAVFGTFNYPFALSAVEGGTDSALAGCAVVHKVHDAHPHLGLRTAMIARDALSNSRATGLLRTVRDPAESSALIDNAMIEAARYTSSARVTQILVGRAAMRPDPIPLYGELRSINPVFTTEDVWDTRWRETITGFVKSFTLGVLQLAKNSVRPHARPVPSSRVRFFTGGSASRSIVDAIFRRCIWRRSWRYGVPNRNGFIYSWQRRDRYKLRVFSNICRELMRFLSSSRVFCRVYRNDPMMGSDEE